MGIWGDIQKAVAQVFDPAFRGVLGRALALSVALFVGLGAALLRLVTWLVPDSVTLPLLGQTTQADTAVLLIGIPILILLSLIAMFPVAAIFVGLFLDRVADAVEARHYPHLPPNTDLPLAQSLSQSVKMALFILLANLLALLLYIVSGPLAPILYWSLNGYLIGREFFHQAAIRRLSVRESHALRRAHRLQVWGLGALLAVPMSLPLINLIMPVIGAAAFTHMYHRFR